MAAFDLGTMSALNYQAVEDFWPTAKVQIATNHKVVVSDDVMHNMGIAGLNNLMERVRYVGSGNYGAALMSLTSAHMAADLSLTKDTVAKVLILAPNRDVNVNELGNLLADAIDSNSTNSELAAVQPEGSIMAKNEVKTKIPRPPNAFILYRKHHHPALKNKFPQLHNNQICK